jgi:RNA exonuclease 4
MMIINRNIESQPADEAAAAAKNTSRVRRRPVHWTKDTPNAESSPSPLSTTTKPKKNNSTRRRRRPVNKKQQQQQQQNHQQCDDDSSSASTTSTVSASLSSSDMSSCGQDQENINTTNLTIKQSTTKINKRTTAQQQTKSNKTKQQTRRKNKKSPSSPTKEIQIPTELTPEEKSRYIALDAEMVGVGPHGLHSRLARITLANYDGECIYDTLVQVLETVTDYRTFVSGITPQDLEEGGSAIPFEECRSQVLSLIQDMIVIGHGLKNDFRVLGITHPWYYIRDTAKYEPFMKVDPTGEKDFIPKKLKVLAKDKLGLVIQEEGVPHCPLEDAVAALELYKKHRCKWEKAMSYKMERTKELSQC